MKNLFTSKVLCLLVAICSINFNAQAQQALASWTFEGQTTRPDIRPPEPFADAKNAAFGPGVEGVSFASGNNSADAYEAGSWSTTPGGPDPTTYIEFIIDADPGYAVYMTGIEFDERRSDTGPTVLSVTVSNYDFSFSQAYGGAFLLAIPDDENWRTHSYNQSFISSKVTVRIHGDGAEDDLGTWRFDNVIIYGFIAPVCEAEIISVDVTNETCYGTGDGTITIDAVCASCDGINYSIDGGLTFQSSNIFTDVNPGAYYPYIEDSGNEFCNDAGNSLALLTGVFAPAAPVAATAVQNFCQSADLITPIDPTGVSVSNVLSDEEKVVWVLTGAPANSTYLVGAEFTTDDCGDLSKDYGELLVSGYSTLISCNQPATGPVGTYTFDAYIVDCVSGCTSGLTSGFSITVHPAPSVTITADPSGDICLGTTDVQYQANITSTDGGTYAYDWCAYNSGNGSGTCYDGFDNNAIADPTRSWTSTAGAKSVGLTVHSGNPGCEAEALYSFNVIESTPVLMNCPTNQTVSTSNNGYGDCTAGVSFTNPDFMPSICNQILTMAIDGGSAVEVMPNDNLIITMVPGNHLINYTLTSSGGSDDCFFTITVEDDEAPVPVCLNPTVHFNGAEEITLSFADIFDTAASTDNCGSVNVDFPGMDEVITCDQIGTVVDIPISVDDGNGNTAACTATITVGGLPCGWSQDDIDCNSQSTVDYDGNADIFTLSTACAPQAPYVYDVMTFTKHELCGDGYIKVKVENMDGMGFAGIQMRNSMDAYDKKIALATNGVDILRRELRALPYYPAYPMDLSLPNQYWLKIVRTGNQFQALASTDDVNYFPYMTQTLSFDNCIDIGLYVYSAIQGSLVTAEFSNVEIFQVLENRLHAVSKPDDQGEADLSIGLYPNPASDELNIDLGGYLGAPAYISVFNSLGQPVMAKQIEAIQVATERLDLSNLEPGMYTITFEVGKVIQTKRVVITH